MFQIQKWNEDKWEHVRWLSSGRFAIDLWKKLKKNVPENEYRIFNPDCGAIKVWTDFDGICPRCKYIMPRICISTDPFNTLHKPMANCFYCGNKWEEVRNDQNTN